jgi:hypothetical protein
VRVGELGFDRIGIGCESVGLLGDFDSDAFDGEGEGASWRSSDSFRGLSELSIRPSNFG